MASYTRLLVVVLLYACVIVMVDNVVMRRFVLFTPISATTDETWSPLIGKTEKIAIYPPPQFVNAKFHDGSLPYNVSAEEKERIIRESALEKKFFSLRSTIVNPFTYDYVVKPEVLCDGSVSVLILVHSFHANRDRRDAIRETWGSVAKNGTWPGRRIPWSLRLAFVLGTHSDPQMDVAILKENLDHNDILQGSFIDDYSNMTLKSLFGFKYCNEFCPSAKFLLKSDDDMIINIPDLLEVLNAVPMKRSIVGPFCGQAKVNREGKWALTTHQYPFKYFPPYEAGSAYVIEASLLPDFFHSAKYVPHIFIDDAFITGILGKILNATHVVIKDKFAFWGDPLPSACHLKQHRKLTGHGMGPADLRSLWRQLFVKTVLPVECKFADPVTAKTIPAHVSGFQDSLVSPVTEASRARMSLRH